MREISWNSPGSRIKRGAMKKERRKDSRFVIEQMLEISLAKEKPVTAKGVNISKGGLLCEVNEPLDLNNRAFLTLTLKQEEKEFRFSCEGVIIRCRKNHNKYYAAIQFTELTADQEKNIEKMLG